MTIYKCDTCLDTKVVGGDSRRVPCVCERWVVCLLCRGKGYYETVPIINCPDCEAHKKETEQ